ncbi:DUF493 domain-containing protein [Anaeromyxobacter paludicola]|uniref:Uncharacterized protein n=1 Tax=Anaeromyxobacter paludicola TaxID=2918171 RepID=A0ABN6N774_9BACT|nr:DUF493 domain-containing protein [Anaeromyxobacter paludicola]BDG07777.1 hypothetical protein AMPC_08900 [Anaeromyxobacter paludicola]
MHPENPGAPGSPAIAYPLDYSFKIMGLAADDFAEHARRLVAAVVGPAGAPPERVRARASSGGKYHSITVVARLESEEQRRGVYLALHRDARVVYYL